MVGAQSTSSERVLLVEGQDDLHVVKHIRKLNQPMPEFRILPKDGVKRLIKSIRQEIEVPERRVVGILVDADDKVASCWQKVTNQIRRAGISPPYHAQPTGTIIEDRVRVGVWLMPDNVSPGELENFVADMIPQSDKVWPLSKDYIKSIPEADRPFSEGKLLRAKVHAWLATRSEPRKMGSAIRTGDLDIHTGNATRFVEWLRELFK